MATKLTGKVVARLDVSQLPHDWWLLQGFYYSPRIVLGGRVFGGEWLLQQAVDNIGGEDQVFHRFTADGRRLLGSTVLRDAGHGNGDFHARRSVVGNVWLWTAFGARVTARTRMRNGTFGLSNVDCDPVDVFTRVSAQSPVPCVPWDVVIRTATADTETLTWRKETDVAAGRNKIIAAATVEKVGPGPHQGSAANRSGFALLNGTTNRSQLVRTYGWDGELTRTLDVSDVDIAGSSHDECEGLGWLDGQLTMAKRVDFPKRGSVAAHRELMIAVIE